MNFGKKLKILGDTFEVSRIQFVDDCGGFVPIYQCADYLLSINSNESAQNALLKIRREIRRSYFLTLQRGKKRATMYNGNLYLSTARIELHYNGVDPELIKKSTGLYYPVHDDAPDVQSHLFSRCINDMSLTHNDIQSDLVNWCKDTDHRIGDYLSNPNLFYKIKQSARKCLLAQGKL